MKPITCKNCNYRTVEPELPSVLRVLENCPRCRLPIHVQICKDCRHLGLHNHHCFTCTHPQVLEAARLMLGWNAKAVVIQLIRSSFPDACPFHFKITYTKEAE